MTVRATARERGPAFDLLAAWAPGGFFFERRGEGVPERDERCGHGGGEPVQGDGAARVGAARVDPEPAVGHARVNPEAAK